ncbi:RND family transporter [Marinoscillum sp. MHG1-6]|uniref:efflux RND transporter permease subunit n=1 Tax=Marinoscillum sp. MHG1-6 TaxID=2959627 RepID=UPI00215788D3|nr:MMPL family transporter [Marinoscillum sp. MHG1-6]
MWTHIANIILKFRITLMVILGVITLFMAYQSQNILWSYDMANIVPDNDPDQIVFKEFKETFGEDGNILALGILDSALYEQDNFKKMRFLTNELERIEGIKSVLGLANLRMLEKNDAKKRFELEPLFPEIPEDQETLDSLLGIAKDLKFYSGQLLNEENGATLILVTVDKKVLNSEDRFTMIDDVVRAGKQFSEITGIEINYAGLPYVRAVNTLKIKEELNKFLVFSVIVTGIILFFFFRSAKAVFFPLIIIGVIVVWVMGSLALLQYKITLLTGLIPSIIVVIGIPNSVYMLNKYHHEYSTHGDQMKALGKIIQNIGVVTFITNFTTAVGFFVLVFTDIPILKEFGIVAGLNIMCTFVVSTIMIPSVFSLFKPPSQRHLKHLEFKALGSVLNFLDVAVHKHRKLVFLLTIVLVIAAGYGISKVKANSYMVDDLPEDSPLKKELTFFETQFSGVMPLEVIVDTGKKRGVQRMSNLRKVNEFEMFLDSMDLISQPVSVVSFIKAARQSFYKQNPNYYSLPNNRESNFILRYLKEEGDQEGIAKSFVDSTGQMLRISLKMPDIGSIRMDSLVNEVITPKIDEIFGDTDMIVKVTGTVPLFIKGNKFLIDNLITSMIFAFCIIAVIMAMLFRNVRMIIISLIPNMIPLLITGGIMGYFGIPLKPSTALIFSIAFGISVDDSIHFLAKYRQELFAHNFFVPIAVSKSLRETGASMIYTSIILFFGFVIFTASEFGGTVALGKLTSITLLLAMFANLIVLPALLLQFDTGKINKKEHPLIEEFPEFKEGEEELTK